MQNPGAKITPLYSQIAVMKEFNLSPGQWRRLARIDRQILHYYNLVHEYHLDLQLEKNRAAAGSGGNWHGDSRFVKNLPKLRK